MINNNLYLLNNQFFYPFDTSKYKMKMELNDDMMHNHVVKHECVHCISLK